MYFMGETKLPEGLLPPPDTRTFWERDADQRAQFSEVVASTYQRQRLAENFNSQEEAETEAYDRRIADIQAATGVKLDNPHRLPFEVQALPNFGAMTNPQDIRKRQKEDFSRKLVDLEMRHPDQVGVIRSRVPVEQDAMRLGREAVARQNAALSGAKDLSGLDSFAAEIAGGIGGMVRDPAQVYASFIGGEAIAAKTVGGRLLSRIFSEGAINAGVEAGVQTGAQEWQRRAGIEQQGFWKQVGLAAVFGGGLGGLMQGGAEVLARAGRATPEATAAMERMAKGEMAVDDVRSVADALGVKVDEGDVGSLSRAMEADADTAAVLRPDVDTRQLVETVRAIETDAPLPRVLDEVDTSHVPPGLRKNIPENIPEVQNTTLTPSVKLTGRLDNGPAVHLTEQPGFKAFVEAENAARLSRLEDFVAMNEADIAHLRNDGALDSMPSERDFSGVRGASDEHKASIVLAELENKVAKTRAEIAAGPKHNVDDAAAQIAYAKQQPQVLVQPELRATKLAEPASAEAVEAAARKLEAAGGAKVKPLDHASPKAAKELVRRDTLDIMDALPGGTDANGNPISTTHAELSDTATRMNDLADLIASCKA